MSDRPAVTPKLIVGLAIAAVGVLLLLDEFGRLDAGDYLLYWPVALIAIGAVLLLQPGSKVGGVIALGAGAWILLYNLGYVDVEIWDLWPLILVIIGGSLLFQALRGPRPIDGANSGHYVNGFAIMGGLQRTNTSAGFLGGDLTAIMGACEIDLTGAQINEKEPVINVFTMWGGIELRVPADWQVVGRVTPIMGAFEDKTRPPREAKHRLIIQGMALMGGVEVRN